MGGFVNHRRSRRIRFKYFYYKKFIFPFVEELRKKELEIKNGEKVSYIK
mgnify:CR=1 FL=1